MYTEVSEDFKSKIVELSRTFRVKLDFGTFEVSDNVFSVKVRSGLNLDTELTLGTTTSATCDVELYNDGKSYKNKKFQLYIGLLLDDGSYEYVPYGYYVVQTATKKDQTIKLTCADMMYTVDKLFKSSISYPTNGITLLDEICKKFKVEYESVEELESLTIPFRPAQKSTGRELIGKIASLIGYNAIFDRQGKLLFKWYEDNGYSTSTDYIDTPDIGEEDFTVNYLQYIVSTKITDVYGDEDTKTGITVNNEFALTKTHSSVWDKVNGFSYRPVNLKQLLGNILLDPWDIVTVVTDSEEVKTIPMLLDTSFDGGITCTIEATELETEEDYKSPSELAEEKAQEKEDNANIILVTYNEEETNIGTSEKELLSTDFAIQSDAITYANSTIQIDDTKSGLLTVNVKINETLYQTYKTRTFEGFNLMSFVTALQGLNAGTNKFSLYIQGSDTEFGNVSAHNGVSIIAGNGLTGVNEWSSTLTISDEVPNIEVLNTLVNVLPFADDFNISLVSPTEININANIPNINVNVGKVSLATIKEELPHYISYIGTIGDDMIEIVYSNPVALRRAGAIDNTKVSFVGYIGVTPTTINVHSVGLEQPFGDNLLSLDNWEISEDKATSDYVEISADEQYTVTFIKNIHNFTEKDLELYTENQLEFFYEVELESKTYSLIVNFFDENKEYISSVSVEERETLEIPSNAKCVNAVVSGERMSVGDFNAFYVMLEIGEESTVYKSSNRVVAKVDDMTEFNDTIAYSISDLNLLNPFTNDIIDTVMSGSFSKTNSEVVADVGTD